MDNKSYIVKENTNLRRDGFSKAIINTDVGALKEHRQKAKLVNNMAETNNKVEKLEQELSEIKDLLKQLINKS